MITARPPRLIVIIEENHSHPVATGCRRSAASLPTWPGPAATVVFVIPDLHRQMHSGPVRVADAWLRRLVWRQDTRLVVTFDESRGRDVRSCCHRLGRGGRIPTIVAGPRVPRGRDPVPYPHYSLPRSIEAAYGLPLLGHAGDPATATIPAVADRPRDTQ